MTFSSILHSLTTISKPSAHASTSSFKTYPKPTFTATLWFRPPLSLHGLFSRILTTVFLLPLFATLPSLFSVSLLAAGGILVDLSQFMSLSCSKPSRDFPSHGGRKPKYLLCPGRLYTGWPLATSGCHLRPLAMIKPHWFLSLPLDTKLPLTGRVQLPFHLLGIPSPPTRSPNSSNATAPTYPVHS